MEYEKLLELVKVVSESNLSKFQYQDGDTKVELCAGGTVVAAPASVVVNTGTTSLTKEQEKAETETGNLVKSPLVGTFYAAASEGVEPFVKTGDVVKKGQTIAIIEAMKLMNDVEAEFDGVVEEVLVKDGQTVEYGQPLFRIV
ncbi:biotin carboxyl carrier protein of acetyl-CoA carboxylase [Lachnospiraceae bacterium KM106-2]|nr:biotin carboxyl carrier protein of acetyl-CoA carboxylase [Lachnospiraceae bacterium KM106-2]